MCARFDFDVDASRCASVFGVARQGGSNVQTIDHLAKITGDDIVQPGWFRMPQDRHGPDDTQFLDRERFFEVIDAN